MNCFLLGGNNTVPTKLNENGFVIDLRDVSNETQAAFDVQVAVSSYCHVVEKRVTDQVSQFCYYWFITRCSLELDSTLRSAFTSAMLFEWMREPLEQQQKRETLKKSIEAMEKALAMGQNA
jgi:6-pyruvoyl-tetrahydropterin synthase